VKKFKAAVCAICVLSFTGVSAFAEEASPPPAAAETPATPPAATAPTPDAGAPATLEMPKPAWDQAANIRAAAENLGKIQRTRGAKGAYDFIGECYKTHSLAEKYGAAFESCIAQDYMQTQVLAMIYSRLTPEQIRTTGVPSAPQLADAMGKRFVSAFSQYKIPVAYVKDFKVLVDQHGLPVFLALVFPNAKVPTSPLPNSGDGVPQQDGKPADKP
jgi:hypothetical protein